MERVKIGYGELYAARKHAAKLIKDYTKIIRRLRLKALFRKLTPHEETVLQEAEISIEDANLAISFIDTAFLNQVERVQFQFDVNYPVI